MIRQWKNNHFKKFRVFGITHHFHIIMCCRLWNWKIKTIIWFSISSFRFLSTDSIDDEDGDFRGKEDREHRTIAETEKNRVTWNTERRAYMEGSAVKRYRQRCLSIVWKKYLLRWKNEVLIYLLLCCWLQSACLSLKKLPIMIIMISLFIPN